MPRSGLMNFVIVLACAGIGAAIVGAALPSMEGLLIIDALTGALIGILITGTELPRKKRKWVRVQSNIGIKELPAYRYSACRVYRLGIGPLSRLCPVCGAEMEIKLSIIIDRTKKKK